MLRILTNVAVLVAAIAGGLYLNLRPILIAGGWGRTFESINNQKCKTVPDLQACESQFPFFFALDFCVLCLVLVAHMEYQ